MSMKLSLVVPRSPFLLNPAVFPPLGVMYLSAAMKNYIDVEVIDENLGMPGVEASGDIIGISFTTPQAPRAYELLDYYKVKGKKFIIAGGPHPTHMAEECFRRGFSNVVRRYGENHLYRIVMNSDQTLFNSIDEYPFPDRDCLPIHKYFYAIDGVPATVIMTSRGCPYDCSFCARIDKRCERNSIQHTIDEIYSVREKYGFEAFMIFDDLFAAPGERLRVLAETFENQKMKFRCFGRTNLMDDWVAEHLAKMGVVEVGLGVESGSDKVLRSVSKQTTRKLNTEAVRVLKRHGIRSKAFLIVGLPGEDHATVEETMSWIEEAKPDDIDVSIFQAMPGSKIYEDPRKFGITLDPTFDWGNLWYKGTPGLYSTNCRTESLSRREIEDYRDKIESTYKVWRP